MHQPLFVRALGLLILALLAVFVAMHQRPTKRVGSPLQETLLLAAHRASVETARLVDAVRREPTNRNLRNALAGQLLDDGIVTGDPIWFQLMLPLLADTVDRDGKNLLGQALRNLHRFEAARGVARALTTSAHPAFGDYLLLGDVELEQGEFDAAAAAYQQAMELRPGALSYGRAAQLNFRRGRLGAAIALNQLAVRSSGAADGSIRSWLLSDAAQFALAAAETDAALALAQAAVRARPTAMARFWRAVALNATGKPATALAELSKLAEDLPSPTILRWASALARQIGRHDEASAWQRTLAASGPRFDPRGYVRWLFERGESPSRVAPFIRQELAARRDPETLALAARLALSVGEVEKARTLVRELLQKASHAPFPEVQRAIADVLEVDDPGLAELHRQLAEQYRFLTPPAHGRLSEPGAVVGAADSLSRVDPAIPI